MHIHHCCNILSLIRFLLFILVIVFLLLGYFWQNVCYGLAGVALIAFLIVVKVHHHYKKAGCLYRCSPTGLFKTSSASKRKMERF